MAGSGRWRWWCTGRECDKLAWGGLARAEQVAAVACRAKSHGPPAPPPAAPRPARPLQALPSEKGNLLHIPCWQDEDPNDRMVQQFVEVLLQVQSVGRRGLG